MTPFGTQFYDPQTGDARTTPVFYNNPDGSGGNTDPVYYDNPTPPPVQEVEASEPEDELSKIEMYSAWRTVAMSPEYTQADPKSKLGYLNKFYGNVVTNYKVNESDLDSLVGSQIAVIKGEEAPEQLGFGDAISEEARFRKLGLSGGITKKRVEEVKQYLDEQYIKTVEQGGRDHAGFIAGLGGTLTSLANEAAAGGAVGAATGAGVGGVTGAAAGGVGAGPGALAGAALWGGRGALMGGIAGQGIRSRGEALESNYFANLDAGMDSNEAYAKALRSAEISGALNMVAMGVDPTKMSTKLLGVAGKGTVGTAKSVAGTTTKGISEQAARTGAGRFAVEQGTRFGVAGGINAATEVADVAQMRLLGNQDASQYRGTLGQRAALSGLVGGAFHTTVPVLGKAFKGAQTIGDGKSWAGKYNTVFREENIAGAMGQLARDMEDAVTGTPRKELADLDVMARTRDVKDQKQAVKVLKEIWTDITGGTDPINFRVVDEDGFKKLKIADDVDATYQGDYANAAQTITAFTNLFRWDKETGQRIPLMHESAHAFMDTLPQPVVSSLKKLYDTEMENFSPTLDRVDADGNVVRRKNVHPDALDPTVNQTTSFREWFAERMAIANDDWAKGRIDIGKQKRTSATPKGVFDRLSLVYRDKVDKISRRIGLKPEGFNAAFRDFLDSGDAYVFDRTMKDTVYPSRTPIIDDLLATNAMASSLDRALADPRTGAERADSLKRDLLEAGLLEGESIPSARDIDRANEWAAIANVEGRKRARQEVAEIDAPEAAPRMSETELATAQNRVQEIDEALAKKGLSRKERSGLRKEKNQIRQQIGESFLEVERKPRTVSPERRAEGRDTREFAEDPEGFRDQYDAGGAERTKIRKEAQEDLNKILRNRDLAAKKAEREAKAAQKQKAKEDATLKERGYTEDQKTGQLEFETRSPIDKVRAKPIKELTPDELALEQQALRDQITSETQAQREIVREGATLKNPTDDLEFSKRGVSNAEARAQMKQRVEKAKSKKAKEKAQEQQQAVEETAKRVDAENAKHPEALPLQIALDEKGNVSFDKKGKVNYQERDYDIRNHPDIKGKVDSEQTNFLAEKIVRELKAMVKNPQVEAAMGWYGRMRVKLQDLFGADIEIMAQLLGATSARTPVDENFKQALDGLSQLARGEYDNLMVRYDAHVKEVDARRDAGEFKTEAAYRKAINKFEELPLRSNGKKFNANSAAVRRVLHGHWLDMTNAPKTPNFAGNLTGRTLEATVDVWAARTMRRLLFEPQGGQWRILPAQETAVGSGWAGGRGTGDFYISQRAMSEAARRLKMNPDDLQAVLWYGEKDLWDRNGWTDAAGKEKSSFDSEAGKLELDRWNAGVTTWQTKETFDPKVQEAARVRLEASVRQNPDLVSARVVDTEGLYGGDRQSSFDIEFSVTKDSDVDTFTREAIRIGEENNQNDVFVSRVVDEDHPNARPAVEVGFKRGVSEDTLQSALSVFNKDVVDGWTIAKSRRGDIIGFRAQFIPEIEHRAAGLKMDEATVIARRDQWQASMRQAIANLDNDVVAFAREHHYDTRVYGREEYANATVAGRDTTLGAELQRRGDALRSDDSGATGNLEYSRRGANARGDGATGPVRTGTALDYGGRRTGSKVAEGRNTVLAEAAQEMIAGQRSRESYRDLVNEEMPDTPRSDLADVDVKAVKAFLRTAQLEKWRGHLKHKKKDVDVRIDINSHKSSLKPENWETRGLEQGEPVFPVTIHEVGEVGKSGFYKAGDPLGYDTFVVLDGPLTSKFDLDRTADIAAGDRKNTIVTVSGKLAAKQELPTNLTLKDGKRLNSRMWHQAAVQPIRSNTLYLRQADGTVGRAVRGENVETSIVHGNTVYVKFKKGTSVADRTRDLGPLEYSRRGGSKQEYVYKAKVEGKAFYYNDDQSYAPIYRVRRAGEEFLITYEDGVSFKQWYTIEKPSDVRNPNGAANARFVALDSRKNLLEEIDEAYAPLDAAMRKARGEEAMEYSRRGGDYKNVPTRRFPKRAGSSANSRDLKAINERRADIATYEAQGLKDYVDQIDNVADVTLRQSVESLRNRAVESDRNFDVANSIAYLDRLRREYKKVKTPERAAELEAEIESTYAAIAKSGTTLGQLINQYKTFKGIVTEDKVAMFNNYLLSKDRKLTDKDKAEFSKLVDAEEAADAKVIEAREKAMASNSMDDIEAVWNVENEAEKAFLAVQKFARTRSPRESKFADWRTAVSGSLLTGVSLMRNFWGNYVNFGAATASRSIAAAVDNVRARITQEDRQVAFAPVEEVKAFVRDSWRETKKLPRKAMHGAAGDKITGEAMRSFAPVAALKQAFTGEGMVVDASTGKVTKLDRLDKVAEAFYGSTAEPMLRGLSVMDDLAKAGARGIRRAEYIKAKKLKEGTKEFTEAMLGMDRDLNKAMDEFALERTYQQDGAAANTMLAIERNLRQSFGEGGVFAYRVLTSPYIKTPVNLAAETMSYAMPSVAVAEGLYKGLVKKDVRGAELAAGKVMVALGLGAMADYLLEDGIISGGPDNSQKVNRARRDSGMGFFRINMDGLRRKLAGEDGTYRAGDETWRLDTLGVAGGAFAVHAEGRRVAEDTTLKSANQTKLDYYLSQDGLASAVGLGRFVMDQTMLRGVALGLDALQSGQLNRVLPNIFNAWVLTPQPFMANNVTQLRAMGHEYKYDTFSANGLASTMEDLYDYKMGNYDGLPLKRDIWGRPVQGTPDAQNAFVFHLLDIRKPEVVRDKARTRLYELYAATGQEDVIPSMPSRNLLLPDGTDLRLSAGLYESYVETVQGAKLQAFEQVVSDPRFNRFYTAQPPQAVELLKKQMDKYGRQATVYWKRTNGQRIYNEYLMLQRQLQETE